MLRITRRNYQTIRNNFKELKQNSNGNFPDDFTEDRELITIINLILDNTAYESFVVQAPKYYLQDNLRSNEVSFGIGVSVVGLSALVLCFCHLAIASLLPTPMNIALAACVTSICFCTIANWITYRQNSKTFLSYYDESED